MKKIIWAITLALVLCLTVVSFTACGLAVEAEAMIKHINKSLEPIEALDGCKIEIYAEEYSLAVYRTQGDKITVQYVEDANVTVTSNVDSLGNVKIEQHTVSSINLSAKKTYLVVGIPSAWKNYNLDVTVKAGSVSIEDLVLKILEVDVGSGSADIDVEKASIIDVDVDTGAVHVEGEATSVDVESRTGAIDVDVSATNVDLSTDTGAINFEIEDSLVVDVETDTGAVRGKIEGYQNNYAIKTEVGTGKCNLKNQTTGDGVHFLEISVITGAVNIKFVNP